MPSEAAPLTGRQIKQLRSLVHHLPVTVRIGKEGITDGLVNQTGAYLEKHELAKCAVLDNSDLTAREAADDLAGRLGATVVQIIGHRFSVYRETSREDVEKLRLD